MDLTNFLNDPIEIELLNSVLDELSLNYLPDILEKTIWPAKKLLSDNRINKTLSKEQKKTVYNLLNSYSYYTNVSPLTVLNHKKEMLQLIKSEKLLVDDKISDSEKITILYKFIEKKACPDQRMLNYIMKQSYSQKLKEVVLNAFGDQLNPEIVVDFIQKKEPKNLELRVGAIKAISGHFQVDMKLLERIALDIEEDLRVRVVTIDYFGSKMSIPALEKVVLNPFESVKYRKLVLYNLSLKYHHSISVAQQILMDIDEDRDLKQFLVARFQNKIDPDVYKAYILSPVIAEEEKVAVLQELSVGSPHILNSGIIDMVWILLNENSKLKPIFISKNLISKKIMIEALSNKAISFEQKEKMMNVYEKELEPLEHKRMINEVLQQSNLGIGFRRNLLEKFSKFINYETLYKILTNPEEDVDFCIDLIKANKFKLRLSKRTWYLGRILYGSKYDMRLKKTVVKYFYDYLDPSDIIRFLISHFNRFEELLDLINRLIKLNFFSQKTMFFEEVVQYPMSKAQVEQVLFLFMTYLTPDQFIRLIWREDFTNTDVENNIELYCKKNDSLDIIIHILTRTRLHQTLKLNLLEKYSRFLPLSTLDKLLFDPMVSFNMKKAVLLAGRERTDLNNNGALDFLLRDTDENKHLKDIIHKYYR